MSNVTEKDVTTQRLINALRVCQGDEMTSEDCMKECPFANADDCGFVRWSTEMLEAAADRLEKLCDKLVRYRNWVGDLQSGMYVNCVYCGHRYGPADKVPVSMAEALKQHIEQCPEHPMSALKAELAAVKAEQDAAYAVANNAIYFADGSDYLTALYQVCAELKPGIVDEEIGKEFYVEWRGVQPEGIGE